MVYRVKALVRSSDGSRREVTTQVAGCLDVNDAILKMKKFYDVVMIHWVKEPDKSR